MTRGVTVDGGDVVIRIPSEEVHSLRVALQPIRAGETTSLSTKKMREGLDKALARTQQKRSQ